MGESVSSGKTLVANAITAKGVSTSASAAFSTMADNINKIVTKSPLANWQIANNRGGSTPIGNKYVGDKLFNVSNASGGYAQIKITTVKQCYITIITVDTAGTTSTVKSNELVSSGYTYTAPASNAVTAIFAYTL